MPIILKFDFHILEIQMLCISFFKILNFDKNDYFFLILKIQKMKNAKIHFSKFEIYMAQSIHGLLMVVMAEMYLQFLESKAIKVAFEKGCSPISFKRYVDDSHSRFQQIEYS